MIDANIIPPPWRLKGNSTIFFFRFGKDFVRDYAFLPDDLRDQFYGGVGSVMLVDYHESPIGPYREALFVPGLVDQAGQRRYTVSKIYVSTIDSVLNGQENWGLPKELADFDIEPINAKTERFRMNLEGRVVLDVVTETLPYTLPVDTRLSLVRPTLLQRNEGMYRLTAPHGSGKLSFASMQSAYVDPAFFPDFTYKRPILSVRATDFTLTFPSAKVLKLQKHERNPRTPW